MLRARPAPHRPSATRRHPTTAPFGHLILGSVTTQPAAHVRLSVPNLNPTQALNAWNYVLHLAAGAQPITDETLRLAANKAAANVQLPGSPERVAAAQGPDDGLYDYFGIPRPGAR